MKNGVLFLLLLILVGLTTIEFQKKVLKQSPVPIHLPLGKVKPSVAIPKPEPSHFQSAAYESLDGEFVCLPQNILKGTTPATETKNCIYGLKLTNGKTYAVNVEENDNWNSVLHAGTMLHIEGKLIPREQLNDENNYFEKNAIVGEIQVSNIIKLK